MKTAQPKSSKKSVAIWGVTASLLLVATILPAANALEISVPTTVEIEAAKSAAIIETPDSTAPLLAEDDLSATASGAIFSSDLALVSSVSRQVELARSPLGAKKVAKSILLNE